MRRVVHVITGLEVGGAELALTRLVEHSATRCDGVVVSLTSRGVLASRIEAAGWPVHALQLGNGATIGRAAWRLRRLLTGIRPDAVITWLPHADVLGGVVARLAGIKGIAWGLRASDLLPEAYRRRTVIVTRIAALLSRLVPARIVCGSEAARDFYTALGFDRRRMIVIPNGVVLPPFDPLARAAVRAELDIPDDVPLIARVARYHPHKDPASLIAALALVRRHLPAELIACGEGMTWENEELADLLDAYGVARAVHLLGRRDDVDRIHMAADVACSSSVGEGFPNVVAEAMATGVPVVATDVGDTRLIVGDVGRVVAPRAPEALAAALVEMLTLPSADRRMLGERARKRIADRYGMAPMTAAFDRLYDELGSTS